MRIKIPEFSKLVALSINRWHYTVIHIRMEGGRSLTQQIYKISEGVKIPPSS
jgi:hypothetical protein